MNLILSKTIKAQFQSYWHIGTGRGAGQSVDALIERDALGLPYVPGKTIKGLMRDIVYQAEGLGFFERYDYASDFTLTDLIFGQRGNAETNDAPLEKFEIQAGIIRVSSLQLDYEHAQWLGSSAGKKYQPFLIRNLYTTKVEQTTGTAAQGSLRGQEVAIPMDLVGEIEFWVNPTDTVFVKAQAQLSKELLELVLAVIQKGLTQIGANKTRGFGQAILTMEVA